MNKKSLKEVQIFDKVCNTGWGRESGKDRTCLYLFVTERQRQVRWKFWAGLLLLVDIGGSGFSTRSTPDSCVSQTGTFSINQTIVFKRTPTLLTDFSVSAAIHRGWIIFAAIEFLEKYEPFVAILAINCRGFLLWFVSVSSQNALNTKRFLGTPPICKSQTRISYEPEKNTQRLMGEREKSAKQITWWNIAKNAITSQLTEAPPPPRTIIWIRWQPIFLILGDTTG